MGALLRTLFLVTCCLLGAEAAAEPRQGPSAAYQAAMELIEAGQAFEAGRKLRALADAGDPDAQLELGHLYFAPGSHQDFESAYRWYRAAADQGHAVGQHQVGIMYSRGAFVDADQAEAVRWYRKAAEGGLASAQGDLAYRYDIGRGVEQDLAKAEYWYEKSAAQGNAKSAHNLEVLRRGKKTGPDPQFERLREAAAGGDVDAQWQLYRRFSEPELLGIQAEKADYWLRKAAASGHALAQAELVDFAKRKARFESGCRRHCSEQGLAVGTCRSYCNCNLAAVSTSPAEFVRLNSTSSPKLRPEVAARLQACRDTARPPEPDAKP